jgi:hypothetical protein
MSSATDFAGMDLPPFKPALELTVEGVRGVDTVRP